MKVAMFLNFTDKPFKVSWNKIEKTYAPGKGIYMEDGIARHHAKHLVNKILIEIGRETMTSPKFPEQVPEFWELFEKAYIPQDDEEEVQTDEEAKNDILNRNRQERPTVKIGMENKPAQVITGPDGGISDDEFEPDGPSNLLPKSKK